LICVNARVQILRTGRALRGGRLTRATSRGRGNPVTRDACLATPTRRTAREIVAAKVRAECADWLCVPDLAAHTTAANATGRSTTIAHRLRGDDRVHRIRALTQLWLQRTLWRRRAKWARTLVLSVLRGSSVANILVTDCATQPSNVVFIRRTTDTTATRALGVRTALRLSRGRALWRWRRTR